ncbi:MAG: response regulator, partial [Chloroflexota bacterium]|nr:response regulator [Chloroflexota bacterium]
MTDQERQSSPTGNGQHLPAHILVVNDTKEILELFRELLEDEGYRVSLSSYAVNDLDEVVELAPDLAILDFIIGGEDQGWQMLQKMRMDRRTAEIPIIVCTAARNLVREIEGHLLSKNIGIVLKPFDIDELVVEVRRRLGHDDAQSRPRTTEG